MQGPNSKILQPNSSIQVASFCLEIREDWSLLLSAYMSLIIERDEIMTAALSELLIYQGFDA